MTARKRKNVLLAALVILLAALAVWAYGRRGDAQAAANRAFEDLRVCRALASKIGRLRHRPNQAGTRELELSVLNARVEQAARAAALARGGITKIWPQPARRVRDTVYSEKPTQIFLDGISMKQLVVFLHTLITNTPGLQARSLRLSASRGRESRDSWAAEAVVSYRIYDPPKTARAAAEDRGF